MSRNMGVEYPHVMVIDIRKFMVIEVLIYIRKFPRYGMDSEMGQVMRWFECKTSSVNRFLMSKNMAVEYPHVMIIDIRKF